MQKSQKTLLERNLSLLKFHRLDVLIFAGAIFIAYQMHTIGLTLTQILVGESVFALFLQVIALPIFGYITDIWSLETMYLVMSGMLLVMGFISGFGIKVFTKQ